MQNKKEIAREARSFPQIWESLSKPEREELTRQFYLNKCCRARQTIWNWGKGKTKPSEPLVQDKISKVVSSFLGQTISSSALFPINN